jgi:hypothetical protein
MYCETFIPIVDKTLKDEKCEGIKSVEFNYSTDSIIVEFDPNNSLLTNNGIFYLINNFFIFGFDKKKLYYNILLKTRFIILK